MKRPKPHRRSQLRPVCLYCHQALDDQEPLDHRGFTIAAMPTSQSFAACHATQYDQFLRSRHAAPAWAAVGGSADFSEDVVAASELHVPDGRLTVAHHSL